MQMDVLSLLLVHHGDLFPSDFQSHRGDEVTLSNGIYISTYIVTITASVLGVPASFVQQ